METKKVRKVQFPHTFPPLYKNVGIYCRVSSRLQEQLNSMANQASFFVQMVNQRRDWNLTDIYLDFKSGEEQNRPEFQRMIDDARNKKLDIILTKSISRFGRDAVEVISTLRELKICNVTVIFDSENINTEQDSELIISILTSIAEEDNNSRSQNQLWGIRKRLEDGTSSIYTRACFGYRKNSNGELLINLDEGKVVQNIFSMYLSGMSIVGIVAELEKRGIKSPSGKEKWCKRTVETMLSNEKYIGNSLVFKTYTVHTPIRKRVINNDKSHEQYLLNNSHPALITQEIFDAVQEEKKRRSNIVVSETGTYRKSTHYSSKKNN